MIEPMILRGLVSPADVIAATIVAEAMLQCKAGDRAISPLALASLKQRHQPSAAQKQRICSAMR
jgi:hypothetical protein